MSVDKSVIETIKTAVEQQPENTGLRLHLVNLLLADNQAAEALRHAVEILNRKPAHVEALEKAALAAEKTGDKPRADAYRTLHAALSKAVAPPQNAAPENKIDSQSNIAGSPSKPLRRAAGDDDEWSEIVSDEEAPKREPLRETGGDFDDAADNFFLDAEKPETTLADVAGMETVKRRLNLAFLAPLKNPEMRRMYGKSLRGGLLLYGPPGCGKTFIARAVAGELGAHFVSIGLSDVLDMWIGSSEKNLHEIFERARRAAPCVLFFDEIDALGRKRSLARSSQHGTINQLLHELDGVDKDNDGVFVLAATNHPWDVDTALRRPGRLDRTLLVLPPDARARAAILESSARGRPVDGSVDFDQIAQRCAGFSGADLTHLVETAAENAMEDSIESGKARAINQNDFKKALKEVRSSTRPWFEVAKNYAQFANEGGVYDDLIEYLRQAKML